MKKIHVEVTVGIFVLIGILCLGYLTLHLGKLELFNTHEYLLKAKFNNIGGLKKDARVEIAGIQVGRVTDMILENEDLNAIVVLRIKNNIKISDDTIVQIKTSGLIGDKYVNLSPGGSDTFLKDGSFLIETQSPLDIEELIGKFVFGKVEK